MAAVPVRNQKPPQISGLVGLRLREGISPLWQMICIERRRYPGQTELVDQRHAEVLQNIGTLLESGYDVNEPWDHSQLNEKYLSTFSGCVIPDISFPDWPRFSIQAFPLLVAVFTNDIELVNLLLQYSANVHMVSKQGTTALHEAVRIGSRDLVQLLLEHGAEIEAHETSAPYLGCTPLHFAVLASNSVMTTYLLDRGANVQAKTSIGWSAVDMAILNQQAPQVDLLLQTSASVCMAEEGALTNNELKSDPQQTAVLARHLLEHRIGNTSQDHQRLYAGCLRSVLARLDLITDDPAPVGRQLILEVEKSLLQLADRNTDIMWPRNFCTSCEEFQNQDFNALCTPYKHSDNFEAVVRSATNGCQLCQAFVEVYNIGTNRRFDNVFPEASHLYASNQVLLQLDHSVGLSKILFGCSERIGLLHLGFLDEEIQTAVYSTDGSDKYGTHSQRTLAIVNAWMSQCQHSHKTCNSSTDTLLPDRIIDVGSDQIQPRLVESFKTKAAYVALSYCRSTQATFSTIRSNYERYLNEIKLQDMPKTIRDAIEITRNLRIQYLWVDTLCVIQDSEEDQKDQRAKVPSVYLNAALIVAIEESSDLSEGIFKERLWNSSAIVPLDLHMPATLDRPKGSSLLNRTMAMPRFNASFSLDTPPAYDTCGWTLQEELLSHRILRCWHEELSWDCLETTCSETLPIYGSPTWPGIKRLDGLRHMLTTGKPANRWEELVDRETIFREWCKIIGIYTARHPSPTEDKLLPLAGVQDRIGNLLTDTPLGGCWTGDHFWRSCLWTSTMNATAIAGNANSNFPSWSWASVPVPITYSDFLYENGANFLPHVTSWNIQNVEQNINIQGGISVSCTLLRVPDFQEPLRKGKYDRLKEKLLKQKTQSFENKNLIMSEHKDPHFPSSLDDIWYMVVATVPFQPPPRFGFPAYPNGRPPSLILMCLEKISNDKMYFRRVGIASAWDGPHRQIKATRHIIGLF